MELTPEIFPQVAASGGTDMKREIYLLRIVILCLLFLLVGKSALAQAELITNGGFDVFPDSPWIVSTDGVNQTDSWFSYSNSSGAHSAPRYRYIGAKIDAFSAANNLDSSLYQTVTIPVGTTSAILSYYVRITTSESPVAAHDHLYVEIRNASGAVLATPASYSNQSASLFSSWTQQTRDLTSYAGQTIRVAFRGVTNSLTITVFRIDDVSLQVSGTTATAPSITTQPASQSISSGQTATLTVVASGTSPLSYQWYQGSSGNTSTPVGSNSSSYTTPSLTATTSYWVRVSNSVDSVDSNTATVSVAGSGGTFYLSFPLTYNNWTPYTAEITTVFDHAMTGRYVPGGGIVAYTDEKGTTPDYNERPYPDVGNGPLYSFKKADGSLFRINGHYVGTQGPNGTGPTTLNYDGHPGYDYPVPSGTDVLAAADGEVCKADISNSTASGNYVRIQHGTSGYQSQYLHLSQVLVSLGAQVTRGQLIGKSGNTAGTGTVGYHLHFEVKQGVCDTGISVDPYGWEGCSGCDPYTAAINVNLWGTGPSTSPEIASLTTVPQQASWVYYQSNTSPQWYISESAGDTYLLSGANGYSGELVWGKIANGNLVATVDYSAKTVYIAPSASAQTSATSYPGVKIYDGTNVTVTSSRGHTAAQQLDGQTLPHAWYFFKVPSTGTWYIVNTYDGTAACGSSTCVYRLGLKPDNSDYAWVLISNSSWTRSFSGIASNMNITLTAN